METSANFVIEEYLCNWEGDEIWIESDTFSGNRMDSKIRLEHYMMRIPLFGKLEHRSIILNR